MKVLIILLVTTPSLIFGLTVEKCDQGVLPLEVKISGCDKQPCIFPRRMNGSVNITFVLAKAVQKLTPMVIIPKISKRAMAIPCPNKDCAKAAGITFPLAAGQKTTLMLNGMTPKVLPRIPMCVWEVQAIDENKAVVVCCKLQVQIK